LPQSHFSSPVMSRQLAIRAFTLRDLTLMSLIGDPLSKREGANSQLPAHDRRRKMRLRQFGRPGDPRRLLDFCRS
jgi:hypothetical protein